MREGQRRGVEEETILRETPLTTVTVTGIVDHGVANGRQMDAYLVRSSGVEL
jgi:hypothetical protein